MSDFQTGSASRKLRRNFVRSGHPSITYSVVVAVGACRHPSLSLLVVLTYPASHIYKASHLYIAAHIYCRLGTVGVYHSAARISSCVLAGASELDLLKIYRRQLRTTTKPAGQKHGMADGIYFRGIHNSRYLDFSYVHDLDRS